MPEVRKKCNGCGHSWLDKYGKDECPKCLCSLSANSTKGGNCGNGQSAGSAMESQSGKCPKNDDGPHNWKFGKCSHCGTGEGGANKTKFGECRKGGKHIYKFAKVTQLRLLQSTPTDTTNSPLHHCLYFHFYFCFFLCAPLAVGVSAPGRFSLLLLSICVIVTQSAQ